MIKKIISGGQTGADMGGLEAARALGIPTGGTAPKDFMTELGSLPELLRSYGLTESPHEGWSARTRNNVMDSEATLILAFYPDSPGTLLTKRICEMEGKLYKIVNPRSLFCASEIDKFLEEMQQKGMTVLNVAGNRESKAKGIQNNTIFFLTEALKRHI